MTTTEQQRRALAFLVKTYRQSIHGAGPWDEPGIIAALTKVQHINLGMQTMAAMRAAADPSIKTPAMIGDPSSSVYVEKLGPERARRHPSAADACHTCGRELTDTCCDNPTRRPAPSAAYTDHAATARQLLHPAAPSPTHPTHKENQP